MKIEFQCRACDKDITVTSDLFGKNIVCPHCNSTMIAPHPKGKPEAGGCKKTLRFIGVSCIVLVIGFCILGKCGNKESSEPVENIIGRKLQTTFNANRQKIFDNIHPIGTAKGIVVHDVSILAWKSGVRTNRLDDVQQFSVRFTLY